jgi:hypothetical protein
MKLWIIIWTQNWHFFHLWFMNYYHWLTCQQGSYDVSKQESTSWKVGWTSRKVPVTKDWFNLHTEPCTSIIDWTLSHTVCTLNFIVLKKTVSLTSAYECPLPTATQFLGRDMHQAPFLCLYSLADSTRKGKQNGIWRSRIHMLTKCVFQ